MPDVDKNLLAETLQLGDKFDMALARLASGPDLDLRMFFTMAHGYITKKIGKHINLFNNPNALMRLNKAFATTYLSAVAGSPHHDWQRAFRVCQAEVKAMQSGFVGLLFLGPVVAESCAACMANVHIMRDLRDALTAIRDVDPQDYGNILVFVMEGNLYAEVQLRGKALGAAAVMVGALFVTKLNLDVKAWRNKVFEDCYKKTVPNPTQAFAAAYHKAEGRKV